MLKKVETFVKEQNMIQPGDKIVVGVSGGPDSVCLLLVLDEMRKKLEFDVIVAHIEHGIRGEDSIRDMKFVEQLCADREIVFYGKSFPVEEIARNEKLSVEEAGRKVRYEMFREVLEKEGANKIAIAHNSNDCAETMLFHLARGTGLRGLKGIEPVRGEIIRPLLCLEREEIITYLKKREQSYCIDATNNETIYTRNKIRHQALPVLKEINQRAVTHMVHTAGLLREAEEYLAFCEEKSRKRYVEVENEGGILLKNELFEEEAEFMKKQVIMGVVTECAGSSKNISSKHLEQLLELYILQTGRKINLPYRLTAERVYSGVFIEKISKKTEKYQKIDEIKINPPGRILLGEEGGVLETRLLKASEEKREFPKKEYTKWFDYAKIKHGLCVRTREPGDFITVDSKGNTKKLKEYFINEKIPKKDRDHILLVADGKEIVWVTGRRISEYYKVSDETTNILEIRIIGGKVHE